MTVPTILEFLAHLRALGISLWVEETQLHYRAAPGSLTPALLDEMVRRKADIIAFLQSAYQMADTARPLLRVIPRDGPLPLSFAQQRLWFLEQLAPGRPTYNIPAAFELSGTLDEAALTAALNAILRRHEVLRMAFPTVEGEAVAVASPNLTVRLTRHAPPSGPPTERRAAAYHQAVAAARRPFDLSDPPLLRAELWPLADDCHLLLLVIHHIVYDGWSIEILLAELAELYTASVTGGSPTLPDLPLQYADYARWQREWLRGETLTAQIAAWRDYLGPDHSLLPLPTDHPRPATQSFAGATQPLHIPPALHRQLADLGQRAGATLFMTFLAAFKLLLYRYTGRNDIRVGTPVGNRPYSETEPLIGFFVNTLVLTTDLAEQPTFLELLHRVRTSALTAYRHQELPFEKLVEALQPERTLSHQPLFQVMFVLETAPLPTLDLPDLTLTPLPEFRTGTAKFDLTLSLTETEEGLTGFIEYSTDLFEAVTIERLAAQFLTLLESIAADPDQPISRLSLLPAPERQRLLVEWNDTATGPPPTTCLHHLFEAQAARRPTAVAAICEGQRITYSELNERANQLAHYLQSLGVGPEVCVGLYMERSLEFVVALLGILKAGGAYVPLDHRLPPERLAFLLADIKAPVVLTQAHLAAKLPPALGDSPPTQPPPARGRGDASPPVGGSEGGRVLVLTLDTDEATLAGQPRTNPTSPITPANLMYVLFTSGSTGQPKGVEIEHRQVMNYLDGIITRLDLPEEASYGLVSTIAADLGNTVLFPALTTGGTLHVMTSERATNPDALAAYLQQRPIDCLKIVPSHLTALLSAARPAQVLPRQRLILGGEASDWELVERLQRLAPACAIFNHYGPTETTIGVTTYRVDVNRPHPSATVPLGRPLPNTHLYILDEQLQPTPTGVPGELHIGGRGVGRGYLNRPDLTAERFIPNPFAADPEARLYKSGDLARYLPDGTIEFLGRIDHQVKIRGFRIELGEIEAALTQHSAVRTALVQAQGTEAGQKRLVAYVVPHTPPAEAEAPAFGDRLREFLRARLPDYMLPAVFISLPRLPLTPNGKIDRDALPTPRRSDASDAATTQPRTETERRLAEIWQQVLGLSQVGVEENFFELGGDSILSIQIIARANQAGLRLTPQQLFQHQTIAALARVSGSSPVIRAEQGLVVGPVPLTPIQHWFFEQALPKPTYWNMPLLLMASRPLHPERLSEALNHLVAHHDALRLRFEPTPQGWRQRNLSLDAAGTVSVDTVDLGMLPEAEQAAARQTAIDAAHRSLDLRQGPLLRAVHLRYGPPRPEQLLLVAHHLLVDGVSWRILLEDLQTAYGQLKAGQPVRLPPKTTAFKRWAEALPDYARSTAAAADVAYWSAQLPPTRPVDLPLDFETTPAANTEGSLRSVTLTLSETETGHLLQTMPKVDRTRPHEALLTALVEAVTGWMGQPALLVDLEGHGREPIIDDVDLSRTVGWFTTHFPVWLDVSKTNDPVERLAVIKARLREIPQHGIGYGLLRYLGAEAIVERLRGRPQPQISFNYLGQFETPAPDALLRLEQLSGLNDRHPDNPRSQILHVEGAVLAGQLHVAWLYSAALHRADTIEALAHRFMDTLRALITQSLSSGVKYTVSSGADQTEVRYPLAPGQRNILASMQADPATPVYVVQICLILNGPLDADRFRAAWRQVVARHEALRCHFAWAGLAEPRQIVQPPGALDWTERDLRDVPETAQTETLADLRRAAREQEFDLTERPPLRFTLVRLAAERQELLWTSHHLLKDGWSTAVILKEVLAQYDRLRPGQAASLEGMLEEPGGYGAYIAWLQRQDKEAAAQFWRAYLAGLTEPTPLPVSLSQVAVEGEPYGATRLTLSAETTAAVEAFARQQRLTLNTLVQAAWALLLGRHAERPEVLFGVVVAGRPVDLVGVEQTVGMLANILPLRVALSPDQPLETWLKALQMTQVEMREYAYCPVAEVQAWSDMPPALPLFESVVRFQNQPQALTTAHSDSPLTVEPGTWFDVWPYPLSLVVEPGEEIRLTLHYERRRFEAATGESMLAEVARLLARLATDSAQNVGTLLDLS